MSYITKSFGKIHPISMTYDLNHFSGIYPVSSSIRQEYIIQIQNIDFIDSTHDSTLSPLPKLCSIHPQTCENWACIYEIKKISPEDIKTVSY